MKNPFRNESDERYQQHEHAPSRREAYDDDHERLPREEEVHRVDRDDDSRLVASDDRDDPRAGTSLRTEAERPPRPIDHDSRRDALPPDPPGHASGVEPRRSEPPFDEGGELRDGRLLSDRERERLRKRWEHVQAAFVDTPREAVSEADALVAETIDELRELFDGERSSLEATWGRGEEVSTETLRVSLQRYRSFFGRLLEI